MVHFITLRESTEQFIDSDGTAHIEISQTITGGLKGDHEKRVIDGKTYPRDTHMLGTFHERCRWINLEDVEEPWLTEGWVYTSDELGSGGPGPNGEMHIEVRATNSKGEFNTVAIWGFTEIDGARYHCRRGICRRGAEVAKCIGIFRYCGERRK